MFFFCFSYFLFQLNVLWQCCNTVLLLLANSNATKNTVTKTKWKSCKPTGLWRIGPASAFYCQIKQEDQTLYIRWRKNLVVRSIIRFSLFFILFLLWFTRHLWLSGAMTILQDVHHRQNPLLAFRGSRSVGAEISYGQPLLFWTIWEAELTHSKCQVWHCQQMPHSITSQKKCSRWFSNSFSLFKKREETGDP